jgi:hypothetical protein
MLKGIAMAVDPQNVIDPTSRLNQAGVGTSVENRLRRRAPRRRSASSKGAQRPSSHQLTTRVAARQQGSIKSVLAAIGADRARSTLVLFGIVIVKVLLVTKGDLYTALGVIKSAGVVAVVVGATLSILPIAAVALLGIGIYTSVSRWPLPAGWRRPQAGAYALLVVALCFIFTPRYIVTRAGVLIPLAGGILERLLRVAQQHWVNRIRHRTPSPRGQFLSRWSQLRIYRLPRIATVMLLLTVVYNPILFAMWLPHEAVHAPGRPQPVIVGYVLDDSGGWTSMLTSGDRKLIRVKSDTISDRVLCLRSYHESAFQSILRTLGVPRLPVCPPVRERIERIPPWFGTQSADSN